MSPSKPIPLLIAVATVLALVLAACGGSAAAGPDTVSLENLDPNELLKLSPQQLDGLPVQADVKFSGTVQAMEPNHWTVANCPILLAYGTRVEGIDAAPPVTATATVAPAAALTATHPITTGSIVKIDAVITPGGTIVARVVRPAGPGEDLSGRDGYQNLVSPPADGHCPLPALIGAPAGPANNGNGGEKGGGNGEGKGGKNKGKGKGKE
jgi:hypothetical protein